MSPTDPERWLVGGRGGWLVTDPGAGAGSCTVKTLRQSVLGQRICWPRSVGLTW